ADDTKSFKAQVMLRLLPTLRGQRCLHQQQSWHQRHRQDLLFFCRRQLQSSAPQPPKQRPRLSDIRRLAAQSRPERRHILAGIGLLAISSGITVSLPFFIGRIVDVIDSEKDDKAALSRSLTRISAGLAGLFLLGGAANAARVYLMRSAGQRIIKRMRDAVYSSTLTQEIAFFDRSRTGELRESTCRSATALAVGESSPSTWRTESGRPMSVYGRYVKRITLQVQDRLAAATQLAEERFSGIRTVRAFAKEAHEIRRVARNPPSYSQETQSVYLVTLNEAKARAAFFGSVTAAGNLVVLCVLYSGGLMMSDGRLSVGNLSAFLLYAVYVGVSINGVSSFYSDLMRGLGASQRLWQLIDRQPLIPALPVAGQSAASATDSRLGRVRGEIKFERVAFSYCGGGLGEEAARLQLFHGLDLTVPAGASVAIVGPSARASPRSAICSCASTIPTRGSSGWTGWTFGHWTRCGCGIRTYTQREPCRTDRSTEYRLTSIGTALQCDTEALGVEAAYLIRSDSLYLTALDSDDFRQGFAVDPGGGRLAGRLLSRIALCPRRRIGCVPQEPMLFSCSVADNIRYGAALSSTTVSQADVEAAARLANAHGFVSALPQGYDTLVGERGVLLSGGQRQRVAIARAIVKNPRVLLLDEATSALDAESEYLVHDALLKVAKGRTVITIAHRLSTIRTADLIGVLSDGRLAELGSYVELMARPNGVFRRLIDRQTL
uniref:ABC transmembrane type-1 domain-containing protein n=1 Tax=Macrostomum lignano TaxID=282301 RepID=A0A1I8J2Y4_9PLAT